MISPRSVGELKDRAASLVALAELLSSRRVGPKGIAASLASAGEACSEVLEAAGALGREVAAAAAAYPEAVEEIRATFERAAASVRALEVELGASGPSAADARTRLLLERAAHAASGHVTAALFAAELFAAAAAPRTVAVQVADVLGFGPAAADGAQVLRATLDAPPEPIATTDTRLLRALVELGVQLVAGAGVEQPHVRVTSGASGGARVVVGPRPASAVYADRRSTRPEGRGALLAMRRLPWPVTAASLARAAASMGGASAMSHAAEGLVTLTFP